MKVSPGQPEYKGDLTAAMLHARPSDVDWFEREQRAEASATASKSECRRRWFSLDPDDQAGGGWAKPSTLTEAEKRRFNAYDAPESAGKRAYRGLFGVSVVAVGLASLSLLLMVVLTPLAQGGWRVDLPVWAWWAAGVLFVFATVCTWIVITADHKNPSRWAVFGALLIAASAVVCVACLTLFAAQLVGAV